MDEKILIETLEREGLYSIDAVDPGGETYRGISRRYHPSWPGWTIIDAAKKKDYLGWKKDDSIHKQLWPLVQEFYQREFWEPLRLKEIRYWAIRAKLFDTAVNVGRTRAILWLQQALNAMNRDQLLFKDLVEDGVIGGKTISAVNSLPEDDIPPLLVWMMVLQGYHYLSLMRKSPMQEKFARGWAKRVMEEL